ncbi:MAG TPA: toluene-4-monooxygenase system B family protein, partial [Polyangiaceae bacterium]|nr:toluene-4-monooxygenase system B family protein [Polyangiaceae bacterium]
MTADELVPLYGFVQGDTLGLLVLVRSNDTVQKLIATLQEAAQVRVAPLARASVYYRSKKLAPELTVAAAGLTSLA